MAAKKSNLLAKDDITDLPIVEGYAFTLDIASYLDISLTIK